ncbi:MAG: excinuclease ABC subunit UvrC [Candidatus Omnitrophota bacterium]
MDIKEKIKNLPQACGVYLIKDAHGDIIYIGKAASIKKRLKTHFSKSYSSAKQQAMTEAAADIDYMPTSSQEAALLLEAALIKKYSPKYNAALKDDKAYPVLKLTVNEKFPRLLIARRKVQDGALYFGPYTNAKLLRSALKLMCRIFPLRSCDNMHDKPCLDFHINQCLGPCADKISEQDYKKIVENVVLFLEGKTDKLQKALFEDMDSASKQNNFELAAKIRDQIRAFSSITGEGPKQAFREAEFSGRRLFKIESQLEDLRRVLNLSKTPDLIEAFDVSNTSGKEAVGSMVVFKNGRPFKEAYRKFKVSSINTPDDYHMMAHIINRRYSGSLKQSLSLPDLILIDGGKGHLAVAKKQLRDLGLWQVPVIAIAKSFELIYSQEEKESLNIEPVSAASLLIQRIRDEAHRFAINYHRLLRSKKVFESELDGVSGIGIVKKRALLEHFGSVDEIKMAELEDLMKVKYINEKQAKKIYDYFNQISKPGI